MSVSSLNELRQDYPDLWADFSRAISRVGDDVRRIQDAFGPETVAEVFQYWVCVKGYTDLPDGCRPTEFYERKVFPWIMRVVAERAKMDKVRECYDVLFINVGQQWEPVALSLIAVRPQRVCFIATDQTDRVIDWICRNARFEGWELTPSMFDKILADPTDTTEQYTRIKEKAAVYARDGLRCAIDITGGKKSMSAGAALLANAMNMDILYLESELDGKTVPWTERLLRLDRPEDTTGHRDMMNAVNMFNWFQFAAAEQLLSDAIRRVLAPQAFQIAGAVAGAYAAMECFAFSVAHEKMSAAFRWMKQYRLAFSPDTMDRLQRQRDQCDRLKVISPRNSGQNVDKRLTLQDTGLMWELVIRCLVSAKQDEFNGRYDFACLLVYRAVEMSVQAELAKRGLLALKEYECIGYTPEEWTEIEQKFCRLKGCGERIPKAIALLDGLFLLAVLSKKEEEMKRPIDHLRHFSQVRNDSRLAHGLRPLAAGNYASIQNASLLILNLFHDHGSQSLRSRVDEYRAPQLEELSNVLSSQWKWD